MEFSSQNSPIQSIQCVCQTGDKVFADSRKCWCWWPKSETAWICLLESETHLSICIPPHGWVAWHEFNWNCLFSSVCHLALSAWSCPKNLSLFFFYLIPERLFILRLRTVPQNKITSGFDGGSVTETQITCCDKKRHFQTFPNFMIWFD